MGILNKISESKLAFGGASLSGDGGGYGFGSIKDRTSKDLLKYAYEKGIRIFDSAPIYGFGESERRIGEGLNHVRDDVFYISKSGVTWDRSKRVDMTNDPLVAKKMFDKSLINFNCDYIDLYMVHWPDSKNDIRYVLEIYQTLKAKGKIRHIGLCNSTEEDIKKATEVCQIEVLQSEFNLFNHTNYQTLMDLYPNLEFMGWGLFDKGILSGRTTQKRELAKDYDPFDCRKKAPWWNQKTVLSKIKRVEEFLNKTDHKISILEFALNFVLSSNIFPLVGAKNITDLEQIINLAKNPKDIAAFYDLWNQKRNL